MPKILDNVAHTLVVLARRQLFSLGYARFAIRDVAKDAGIATGTVYNYFKSKLDLVANVMLQDWLSVLESIDGIVASAPVLREALQEIYTSLQSYCRLYRDIWAESQGSSEVRGHLLKQGAMHSNLREHVAQRIGLLLDNLSLGGSETLVRFLAENLLALAMDADSQPGDASFVLEYLEIVVHHAAQHRPTDILEPNYPDAYASNACHAPDPQGEPHGQRT